VKTLRTFIANMFAKLAKLTAVSAAVWSILFVVTAGVATTSYYLEVQQDSTAQATFAQENWGQEALEIIHDKAKEMSPVEFANACGLGASSCFRCHNGKRAALPDYSPTESPWHDQHKSVNYSCTGCHAGNPRILKQEIAHKNLIANSVNEPEKTCATCHAADEVTRVLNVYSESHPQLFKTE
jgi:nitrate/TMAO reductase-like tetraheme cytochrome c subunit